MARLKDFIAAQDPVFATVLNELRAGRKQSHWMWFVFPQLAELGRSPTAKFYGLAGLEEAQAYLAHPVLGSRLLECTRLVNALTGRSAHDIFGAPDDLKFWSCVTLFHHAAPEEEAFAEALREYYGAAEDGASVTLLRPA